MKTGLGILMAMLCFAAHADAQHRGFGGFYRQSLPFASVIRTYGYPSFVGIGSYGGSYGGAFGYGQTYGQSYGYVQPVIQPQIIYLQPQIIQQPPQVIQLPPVVVPAPPVALPQPEAIPVPLPTASIQVAPTYAQAPCVGQSYGAGIGALGVIQPGYQGYGSSQGYGFGQLLSAGYGYGNRFFGSPIVRSRLGGFGTTGFVGAPFRSLGGVGRVLGGVVGRVNFGGRAVGVVTRRR